MSKGVSRVGRAIDWDYLNKVVTTADGKRDLQALRRAYDDVAATIQEKFTIVSFSLRDLVVVFGSIISKPTFNQSQYVQ